MRLFTALLLPPSIKQTLAEIAQKLQKASLKGNFSTPDNYHLTLVFLGEATNLKAIRGAIAQVKFAPFTLTLGQLGSFSRGNQEIVWLGLKPSPELLTLQRQLAIALGQAGFPPSNQPYQAHLTLARAVVWPTAGSPAAQIVVPNLSFPAERIALMVSERQNGRLVYREL